MRVIFYDPYAPDGHNKSLGIRALRDTGGATRSVAHREPPLSADGGNAAYHQLPDAGGHAAGDVPRQHRPRRHGRCPGGARCRDERAPGRGRVDVLETEPPLDDSPLMLALARNPSHPAHDRLIINPHAAFYSEEGLDDMRIKGSRRTACVLLGERPRNVVN